MIPYSVARKFNSRCDSIRCLAVMKLARSVFAYKNKLTPALYYTCRAKRIYKIYADTSTDLLTWLDKWLYYNLIPPNNQTSQYTYFCHAFLSSCSIVFAVDSSRGYFAKYKCSLHDLDKRLVRLFVIHFFVKYSDRLFATAALKISRLSIPFGICQTVSAALYSFVTITIWHL